MNRFRILKKDKLDNFLNAAMESFRLIAPQESYNGDFLFQEIEDVEKIRLDYNITSNTIKEFFFPQREAMFEYQKKTGGTVKIVSVQGENKKKTIFFGLRPCDVRAIKFHDSFFAQEPKDNLYWQKREKGILISLACNEPARHSCFCVLTGGPCLEKDEGFDLQLIDLANIYLVEIGTAKGQGLIERFSKFFGPADKNIQDKKCHIREGCLKRFSEEKGYDVQKVYRKLKGADLNKLWEGLGKRCTNCGGCEFICPTCFCFYTKDVEHSNGKGQRLRAWDSCTFSGYSRMAGDVNPHETNADRISRRFFCKLYNCYNWFKMYGCTGCGRCSFVCPVNLDMQSFIASLMESDEYKPLLKEL